MSDTLITSNSVRNKTSRMSPVDRVARILVHNRLGRLHKERIQITDELGSSEYGQPSDNELTASLRVLSSSFYRAVLTGGALGFAESYINRLWDTEDLTTLLRVMVRNIGLAHDAQRGPAALAQWLARAWHRIHDNTLGGSRRNIHAHYDLGNDLFELFLDPTMTYSSGIFEHPHISLEEASIAKLDRLCRKLDLGSEDHLLEIGTGWGSMAIHAAQRYGCRVTTTTISREQFDLANQRITAAGLNNRVELLLADYRKLSGRYDKLVSIEMIEAVGHRHLDTFFAACSRLLKPEGVMALQAINMNDQHYRRYLRSVDFIQRYVFPGSCCPSLGAVVGSIGRATDMRLFHVEEIGPHYAETLRRWRNNFESNTDRVRDLGYSDAFQRLWQYYLCYCEAGFEERYIGTIQAILTKPRCRRAPLLSELNTAYEVHE